ncbi:hypothetical protein FRC07_008808 [Ceratobasidium sp. 392]|nr:hypothetical protein FRC07_008808 [Ceratobasidium sp. 392]
MSASPTPADVFIAQALANVAGVLQASISLAIITFDQEVKFVWQQQWTFGKAMFLFIRHFSTLLMLGHVASMLLYNPSLELYATLLRAL